MNLKMEAIISSDTSVVLRETIKRDTIPELFMKKFI
jgi:hypothetical protein